MAEKDMKEKLVELLREVQYLGGLEEKIADHLITHGVTVQEWISVDEPPKDNGYYLCVVCVSAVNQRKEYRHMILFWEDNVWIDMANCFRTKKPMYWMPMAEMPQPPKGE